MSMKTYFDHSATTPLDERVLEAMQPFFSEKYGNASSLHTMGQEANEAMEHARCSNDARKNHTRCKEHGGGDILNFFARDMQEDVRDRFYELYVNIVETYKIDETNLFICNILAMTCREIVTSHSAKSGDMVKYIQNAISMGRDLMLTPRERKTMSVTVTNDTKRDKNEIEAMVRARIGIDSENSNDDTGTVY